MILLVRVRALRESVEEDEEADVMEDGEEGGDAEEEEAGPDEIPSLPAGYEKCE